MFEAELEAVDQCLLASETGARVKTNYCVLQQTIHNFVALKCLQYALFDRLHFVTKKKCLSQQTDRHILVAEDTNRRIFQITSPVGSFRCFVLIFSFVMVSMKNFETYTIDRYYSKKHPRFFSEVSIRMLLEERGSKCKKRNSDFEVVKYAILDSYGTELKAK